MPSSRASLYYLSSKLSSQLTAQELKKGGLRVEIDNTGERLGKLIRTAEVICRRNT